jgi:hypothetical protein
LKSTTRRNGLLLCVIAVMLLLAALFAYKYLIVNGLFDPFLPYRRWINLVLLVIAGFAMLGFLSFVTGSTFTALRAESRGLEGWRRVLWILGLLSVPILFACAIVVTYFLVMNF